MFDFPSSPTVGQKYPVAPPPGVSQYAWDGEKWTTYGGSPPLGAAPATVAPLVNADAAAIGSSIKYAREDHVHPGNFATAADYLANTAGKVLTTDKVWTAAVPISSGPNAALTPNFGAGLDFYWIINGTTCALNNPTSIKAGQKGVIYVQQDTASRLITTWGTGYKFAGGTKPVLSTAAGAVDAISYAVLNAGTPFIACTFSKGFA